MRALLAFDKFKDALTALNACQAVARALNAGSQAHELTVDLCPLADGGEGFADILTHSVGATLEKIVVRGPRGNPSNASLGFVPLQQIPAAAVTRLALPAGLPETATIAVIEMAAASGLALLPSDQRNPWLASSHGTGELIRRATERGVGAILLGVGGSATNDLGLGALAALGFSFHDASGRAIDPIPAHWKHIVEIRTDNFSFPPIRIACDVSNPLLGPRGATAVYGPQKGLVATDYAALESEASRLAHLLVNRCGQSIALMHQPGAGAAGGIAFGLMTAAGAQLLPGFELMADWLDLESRLQRADLVITGEGRFDETSLQGKGPGAVVARALQLGKPVHVFAGQIRPPEKIPAGLHLHAITPAEMPLIDALRDAEHLLEQAARRQFP